MKWSDVLANQLAYCESYMKESDSVIFAMSKSSRPGGLAPEFDGNAAYQSS